MDTADDPPPLAASHLRIARPSRDLARTERFWVSGLGLQVLERIQPQAEGDPPKKTCWSFTSASPPAIGSPDAWWARAGGSSLPGTPTGTGGA
jgi:hypothetical protein